ncbi:MAG: 2-succinyl-5-enolpyruvyl-6-hydroxy-3-cyclohexene-1-carboxylic-acid synthase [Bdellovibrionales bacterium GWA2_49_15]|nr:MAG: 2-succinyl-5-enolpyruvyl-6-hydroxy-3-cyclohexene-1-carboxylic-acid synthase [Bdellovibrionales bacterium GWA2_49_15]HAZ13556.1 2-succinyl-5-enolpyruvyl-6-hydroxy-3-cyclohexene-1-carboxylic-acid synthase [Bdellovibrionales bacterium]
MSVPESKNINQLFALLIIDQMIKNKVRAFFVSPGMRNAPLLWAIDQLKTDKITVEVGIDERAHAFRALGFAKVTGETPCLLCTSGTAMANYFPAVLEAQKSQTSLLILSADRPASLVYATANQTLEQPHLLAPAAPTLLTLDAPALHSSPHEWAALLGHALHRGQATPKAPSHINISFTEPLDGSTQSIPPAMLLEAENILADSRPYTRHLTNVEPSMMERIFTEPGMVVIGELPYYEDHSGILDFLKKCPWPFYADVTSSLKFDFNLQHGQIPTFDHPEVMEWPKRHALQYILHLGGRVTSKHYYSFLDKNPETQLIAVNASPNMEDPALRTRIKIHQAPHQFVQALTLPLVPRNMSLEGLIPFVQKKMNLIHQSSQTFPALSKTIIELAPDKSLLVLGNSTAVRSFDSYTSLLLSKHLSVITNRGVSGIEGLLATAIGASDGLKAKPVTPITLVLGDISAMHDLNSLLSLRNLKAPLVIIVANDFGGGIFKLLGLSNIDQAMEMMTTPHDWKLAPMAESMGINCCSLNSQKELAKKYPEAIQDAVYSLRPIFMEFLINPQENLALYNQLKTIKV